MEIASAIFVNSIFCKISPKKKGIHFSSGNLKKTLQLPANYSSAFALPFLEGYAKQGNYKHYETAMPDKIFEKNKEIH